MHYSEEKGEEEEKKIKQFLPLETSRLSLFEREENHLSFQCYSIYSISSMFHPLFVNVIKISEK